MGTRGLPWMLAGAVACGASGSEDGSGGTESSDATTAGQTAESGPGSGSASTTGSTGTGPTSSSTSADTGDDTGGPGCTPELPTFADGLSPSSTLHVAAGAAPGGDGSEASPFDTLLAGLNAATPGTEVRVSGELPAPTYTTDLLGTADAPIWITGDPGAHIGPLTLEGASHVVVRDLELSGSADGHVLHFFFADHLLLSGLRIHDAGLGCIKGSQATDVFVQDVELWASGNASEHPLLDYVGVNTGHIVRSTFREGPGVMVMLKGGTSDMLFAFNEVLDQTTPGNALSLGQSTGPQFFQPIDAAFEGLRIVAFGNLLHDLVGAPFAFEGCKDCAALHNTVWNTTGAQLVRFLPGAAGMDSGQTVSLSEGCRFAGNIVVGGQTDGASLNADAQNIGPNNVIDYNVFLKPGPLNWWGDIEQDLEHSTYDQDPMLDPSGVPANIALVDMAGPPDIAALPFADTFVRDATGTCITIPADIGALEVP